MSRSRIEALLAQNESEAAKLTREEWRASDARQPRVNVLDLAAHGIGPIDDVPVDEDGNVRVDDLLAAYARASRNRNR